MLRELIAWSTKVTEGCAMEWLKRATVKNENADVTEEGRPGKALRPCFSPSVLSKTCLQPARDSKDFHI